MYVLPVLYSCRAVAVPLHCILYSRRATVSTGNARFTRFVLVPCCSCTIAPCVGNVPFTRFYTRAVLWLYHCTAFCTRAVQRSARVMYVLPVLYWCRVVVVQLRSQPGQCTFYPFCTRAVLWLYHCAAFCTRAVQRSARVMHVLPVLYSCRAVVVQLHRV